MFEQHALSQSTKYTPCVEEASMSEFKSGLDKYIRRKVYDTSFGDIVPNIMADTLGIDIMIIEKRVNETTHTCTFINGNTDNRVEPNMGSSIYVYKCYAHYTTSAIL